ncbi:cell division protein FtsZ [Elysia marginata]|uniref:Cell division protein FtsZ n=1 Tax=Elysia marginata TaxID=1093978 RepID=A0AAV4F1G6_9GAST|nr:cell division protein FtsZ [Elysia marginata]
MEDNLSSIEFDLPKNQSNVIKVIGLGGGGGNAINFMFNQHIPGIDFVICNTDSQALRNSPVSNKIQLGVTLTEGRGAGANPKIGEEATLENIDDIKRVLENNTKMVFITAGMGGGTGTGAAPVVARLAKDMGILTVGIVTTPFSFEGPKRQVQAVDGLENLREVVDALIVINNNKLREIYGNLGYKTGFSKSDEVLTKAARGIADVITHYYTQNIDFEDVKTVLSASGTAIMGSAVAGGDDRAKEAIVAALESPLLNDNKIEGAKDVLLLIISGSGEDEITMDEIGYINEYIQRETGYNTNIIMGMGEDEGLGGRISVTIIATGFGKEIHDDIVEVEPQKIVHVLNDEEKQEPPQKNEDEQNGELANEFTFREMWVDVKEMEINSPKFYRQKLHQMQLSLDTENENLHKSQAHILGENRDKEPIDTEQITPLNGTIEEVMRSKISATRGKKIDIHKRKNNENEKAYLENLLRGGGGHEFGKSNTTLSEDINDNLQIRKGNSYLDENVD